jgi:16S rRNA pseudouridine516 synthase
MRLDKYISFSVEMTRNESRKAIRAGLVSVNDVICRDAGKGIKEDDKVEYSQKQVFYKQHLYLMINKPPGFISASRDKREKTVFDLLDDKYQHRSLSCAGRLDKDARGLMILTDDGELVHNIISPSSHVPKVYRVKASGNHEDRFSGIFALGVMLDDGYVCLPAELDVLSTGDINEFNVTVFEGRFHQVKRMFAAVGLKVIYLERISIKGIELDPKLLPGHYRELSPKEVLALKK